MYNVKFCRSVNNECDLHVPSDSLYLRKSPVLSPLSLYGLDHGLAFAPLRAYLFVFCLDFLEFCAFILRIERYLLRDKEGWAIELLSEAGASIVFWIGSS